MNNPISIKLLTHTRHPVETMYLAWEATRSMEELPTVAELHANRQANPACDAAVRKLTPQLLNFPICEHIYFTFLLEHIPIALREQIVRHRVGHRFGENFGIDIIPTVENSSFWVQGSRFMDMSSFAAGGQYYIPEEWADKMMPDGKTTIEEYYKKQMWWIESAYKKLISAGLLPEEARFLIPLGATHRMTWTLNLRAMSMLLSKRSCWIAQLGMWKPIIFGMQKALQDIDPVFTVMANPPCIEGDKFASCPYGPENINRVTRKDSDVPCPVWINHNGKECRTESADALAAGIETVVIERINPVIFTVPVSWVERYARMEQEYGYLWQRDMHGDPMEVSRPS